jgi:hypothetical protein
VRRLNNSLRMFLQRFFQVFDRLVVHPSGQIIYPGP